MSGIVPRFIMRRASFLPFKVSSMWLSRKILTRLNSFTSLLDFSTLYSSKPANSLTLHPTKKKSFSSLRSSQSSLVWKNSWRNCLKTLRTNSVYLQNSRGMNMFKVNKMNPGKMSQFTWKRRFRWGNWLQGFTTRNKLRRQSYWERRRTNCRKRCSCNWSRLRLKDFRSEEWLKV